MAPQRLRQVAAVVHDRGVFSCPGCGLEELSEAVAKKGRIMGRIKGIQGYESKNHTSQISQRL